jgi:hypothetical protein
LACHGHDGTGENNAPFLVLILLLLPSAALAECIPYEAGTSPLKEKYGEVKSFWGLADKNLLELWVNEDTGTWTIVVQTPDGLVCSIAAGDH